MTEQTPARSAFASGRSGRMRRRAPGPGWGRMVTPATAVQAGLLALAMAGLFAEDLRVMVQKWRYDDNWSHGFLIPLFSLYFLHQRRARLAAAERRPCGWGLALIVVSLAGYAASAFVLRMGYPRLLALLGVIFGTVLYLGGWQVIRVAWLPILFLFFALPLPQRTYFLLTFPMRQWASTFSAAVLDAIPGLDAEALGVVIEGWYKGQYFTLNVAQQCAGMRLLMAFLALGVAMAFLSDRPLWHRVVLVLSTLPIALFCNFVRVTVTGVLYVMVDPVFAENEWHTLLGLLMLPVAFVMYWGLAGLLNRLYVDESAPTGGG